MATLPPAGPVPGALPTSVNAAPSAHTTTAKAGSDGPVYVDTQHDDMIHDAQMDYYGTKLATASSDRTVRIYDVTANPNPNPNPNQSPDGTDLNNGGYTNTATLQGHSGPVWGVSWSHPKFGIVLASCSFDGSVILHRESRPREWTTLYASRNLHNSSVNSVKFAPHEYGLLCVAGSSDGRVSILKHEDDDSWNVEYINDNALGVNSVDFAPYTAYANTSTSTTSAGVTNSENPEEKQMEGSGGADDGHSSRAMHIVTGGCDNRIRFWKKDMNGSGQWELDVAPIDTSTITHTDWVRDVAWAPSILPNTNMVASCSEDRTVIIWTQVQDKNNDASASESPWVPTLLNTFEEPVWRVSWSVTGSILAVSSGDNTVTLWKKTFGGGSGWAQVSSVHE